MATSTEDYDRAYGRSLATRGYTGIISFRQRKQIWLCGEQNKIQPGLKMILS